VLLFRNLVIDLILSFGLTLEFIETVSSEAKFKFHELHRSSQDIKVCEFVKILFLLSDAGSFSRCSHPLSHDLISEIFLVGFVCNQTVELLNAGVLTYKINFTYILIFFEPSLLQLMIVTIHSIQITVFLVFKFVNLKFGN